MNSKWRPDAGLEELQAVKVKIDPDRCQSHGRCHAFAPELFHLDELGFSYVEEPVVPDGLEEKARLAVGACPERAIAIED